MNSSINYTDFDRITDTIMFLDNIHTLDFCTRLSGKDKNGYRRFYEFESQYQSNQYLGTDIGRSIKRNMNFYYIINNKNSFISSIILKTNDVYILNNIITNSILPWFFAENRLFKEKDKKLVIIGQYKPVEYIKDLQNWIRFEPIVIEYEDSSYKEGIRMTISSNEDFIDMNIDKFLEFYSYLNHQNMYLQSEAQCNYAKMNPYNANMLVMAGGLGSGGYEGGEKMAENKYGYEPNNNGLKEKKSNDFLNKAKKKG